MRVVKATGVKDAVLKGLERFREKKKGGLFSGAPFPFFPIYFFTPGTAPGSIPYKSLKLGTLRSAGMGW